MLFSIGDRVRVRAEADLLAPIMDKVTDADGDPLAGYVDAAWTDEFDRVVRYMVNFPSVGSARLFVESMLEPAPEEVRNGGSA